MEREEPTTASGTKVRAIKVTSPAFVHGARIPMEHARERAGISPAIHWSGLPEGTRSLALLCEDADHPGPDPFVHWLIYNIPPHASPGRPPVAGLPYGVSTDSQPHEVPGSWQGVNGFGEVGYAGPHPPPGGGDHRYVYRVLALDTMVLPHEKMTRRELFDAARDHILGSGEIMGTYSRWAPSVAD